MGKITNSFMRCPELTNPRIKKSEIKKIILNNREKFLKPERRLDAYIKSEEETLFKSEQIENKEI
ncbi:HindVP family restriction endonuclease [Clostridium polyendosporum]|nr:HindVP family restriction endonuclease [Clostridium polyendosporum]